ncbi:hypothetical protein CL638_00135 [bacterium]|nr:hypothetical protein [bacterium]
MKKLSPEKLTDNNVLAHKIAKGLWFQVEYQAYLQDKDWKSKRLNLKTKNFYISDTNEKYRVINHWGSSDLLLDDNDGGWRSFSLLDIAWIKTISALRELGLSIKKTKEVKKHLFEGKSDFVGLPNRIFEFYVMQMLLEGKDGYLIVYEDGSSDMATREDLAEHFRRFGMRNHIAISLKSILKNISVLDEELNFKDLTDKEKTVLMAVLSRDFDSIKIKMKNGDYELFEKSRKEKEPSRPFDKLREVMSDGSYQNIEILRKGGKVVSLVHKTKHKV